METGNRMQTGKPDFGGQMPKNKATHLPGLQTCPICNFALTALAHAADERAAQKATAGLELHLRAWHGLSESEVAERMNAAKRLVAQ
jgi:hypothetical protein